VWALVVPGVVLTHLSLVNLLPHISDLPQNIIQGFDETFKFAYLEKDSKTVEAAAAEALLLCDVNASMVCPSENYPTAYVPMDRKSNTTAQKEKIVAGFQNSLSVIKKVASDKYFGVKELKPTANSLNKIVSDLDQLNGEMSCFKSTPLYCNIHRSAAEIVTGMSTVTQALATFKDSEIVKRWTEHEDQLVYLHALPYVMVFSLLCFSLFWIRGGVCCCFRDGTIATLALIPFALCWLTSFVIYLVIFILGVGIKYLADKVPVFALRGAPSLEKAIAHLQTNFPAFWNLVFADMVDGLDLLFKSSAFIVVVALLIALYSGCVCCCCRCSAKVESRNDSRRSLFSSVVAPFSHSRLGLRSGLGEAVGRKSIGVVDSLRYDTTRWKSNSIAKNKAA